MPDFVHLHVHSHYSLLDGLGKVEEYVTKAKKLGMTAVALTDKGNVHGLIDLYKACKKEGLKAILGCEMYLAIRSRFDKEAGIDNRRHHIVLLAKNQEGYENLLQLSSEGFLSGMYYKPRIDMALLKEHSAGLIAILPRVNGEVARLLLNGENDKAGVALQKYQEIFGADVYLEMLYRPHFEQDELLQKELLALAKESGVRLVATNDVYYLDAADADAHDTLLAMQLTSLKNDPNRFRVTDYDLSFVAGEQMQEWFAALPEALENTAKIAAACNVEFEFGTNQIPQFPLPETYSSEKEYLRFLCVQGIAERYGFDPEKENSELSQTVLRRLEFELEVIGKMGFDGYFLIVWDFMRWAREQDIAVGPGRGSAAGSIVAYLLKITNLDPLKYSLLFERFLNPERISMPDIDLDFADDRRDEVIEYVRQKYGYDHVAQICTFGTMAARAAVKDVGRVMGIPFAEMNEFGKLIPERPGTTLADAEKTPELKQKLESDETARKIYEDAKKLEGNVRHISVHACAVLITPEPILKYTAIQHPPKDETAIITQYSAKPLEELGLLKMDFLGLRNLTILERAKTIIKRTHGQDLDLEKLPMDDQKTFELLTSGFTTGVFQLESAGMRRYLKQLKPTDFEDIIAMVSLYRPGPMQFIPDYIDRKHGKKHVSYVHQNLEKILKPTFGIAIYQEQILQMAQVFAGFSLGEADLLRRAIGKKIAKELKAQRQKFIDGAKAQGYEEKLATYVFDDVIEPFANYGFNRSHAACYAFIAYQTAYLKANYQTEFFAALLSCDQDNTDRVVLDIEEARHFGITVLPPDVNESFSSFTVTKPNEIRFGLNAIKGIGESVVREIRTARQNGRFETFADFLARLPGKAVNKKSLEALAKSGALSGFIFPRAILENLEYILSFARTETVQNNAQQDCLFGTEHIEKAELALPPTEPAKMSERLRWEKEVLGIYVSSHPLQGLRAYFEKKGTPIKGIPEAMRFKKEATIHGLCTGIRKLTTKKNEVMAILTVEDLSGKIETVLFPKKYAEFQEFLREDAFLTVKGKAEKRNGEWQMVVESLSSEELETIREKAEKEGLINMQEAAPNAVEAGGDVAEENTEHWTETSGENSEMSVESTMRLEDDLNMESRPDGDTPEEEMSESALEPLDHMTSSEPAENIVYRIALPEDFSREKMQKLHKILSEHPGETAVEIEFQGHKLPLPFRIQKSAALETQIQELAG